MTKFHSSASNKKFGGNKVGKAFRNEYLKKKKKMSTLSSSDNLKKHLSTNKSFSSLHNKHFAKNSNLSTESERWKQLEKLGKEKGIRKCEIKLVNHSIDTGANSSDPKVSQGTGSTFASMKSILSHTAAGLHKYKSQSNLHSKSEC